jgi:Peptidase family M48
MTPGVNRLKTWILIAAMGGLFVLVGAWLGGTSGALLALGIGLVFNLSMYWFSDKIAIATTRSKPVTEAQQPALYRIVRELAQERHMPMPAIFVSDMSQPNAFATGRSPEHASVAVTQGILQILDERELRGVLAHELSHVTNRDILIGSIAAAIGMSITFLARFAFFFGGDDNRGGGMSVLFAWILALGESRRGPHVHREPDGRGTRRRFRPALLDPPSHVRSHRPPRRDRPAAERRRRGSSARASGSGLSPAPHAIVPSTARTCSMVVRGLTKHRRATCSPFHDVGWTKAICAARIRFHHRS